MTEASPASRADLSSRPRRTHPLTPVAEVGDKLPGILLAVFVLGRDLPGGLVVRLGLALLVAVVGVGIGWLVWWRRSFWFDADGDLRIASGVLTRNERRVQLSRLQSVEVSRPFLARLVGLAEVKPEVAGGENAHVRIAYLSEPEAVALRAELLARSAGVRGAEPAAVEAPERVLVRVPPRDLAVSTLLNENLILGVLVGGVIIVAAVVSGQSAGLVGLLLAAGIPGAGLVNGFLAYYDFSVAESPDGLRLRSGLLSTRAQTVPPGRVQAIRVAQPLLWRRSGWYRVSLNVAGSNHREGEESGVVLLPVAPYPVVHQLLSRVLPGVDIDAVDLVPAPRPARFRAPMQHPRLACGLDDQVFVSRGGRLVRRVDIVPHARTQSVRVTQGPWQRWLGLASVHVDSTPGPVKPAARQRAAADARALAEAQAAHAATARLGFRPERWARSNPPATETP